LIRRGDLVLVALAGDHGKPRPALVVQADAFNETSASVSLALISSEIVNAPLFRITVEPSSGNGLRVVSQVMADKVVSVRRERLGPTIGHLEDEHLQRVSRALMLWLGLAA
jgi:mRNA interferase MazF